MIRVRVLAILYCYPPLLVPAAMCYAKLMLGLRASGVELELLTITPDSFASPGPTPLDHALADRLPAEVVQHQVDSPENRWWMQLLKRADRDRRFR